MKRREFSKSIALLGKVNFLFRISLICLIFLISPLAAQNNSIANHVYKDSLLLKISRLVEEKYVLSEEARIYANKFDEICQSGAYDMITHDEQFVRKVI